jgi:hypothetical protein
MISFVVRRVVGRTVCGARSHGIGGAHRVHATLSTVHEAEQPSSSGERHQAHRTRGCEQHTFVVYADEPPLICDPVRA